VGEEPERLARLVEALDRVVLGRRRELEVVVAALAAGRDLVLEGPPGTGKSTLLRAYAELAGQGFVAVEGTAELTPARLLGHHDPSRVLDEGYTPATFLDGPLLQAMRAGALLYVEEVNRVPEETLNVLVGAMSARRVQVPRLGEVRAAPGFVLAAAMNPFDAVGTARISQAIADRTCRVAMGYQDEATELAVVRQALDQATGGRLEVPEAWLATVLAVVRATRVHPALRSGASVRGAIDLVLVADRLAGVRRRSLLDPEVGKDAALCALSGRVRVDDLGGQSADEIVAAIWDATWAARLADPEGDALAPEPQSAAGAAGPPVLEGAGKALAPGGRGEDPPTHPPGGPPRSRPAAQPPAR
jgi:MoxR-like ATPase